MQVGEDRQFYYEFINEQALEKTPLTKNAIGQNLRAVLPMGQAERLEKKYIEAVITGRVITYEDHLYAPTGSEQVNEVKLTPLFSEGGVCTHVVAVARDITDFKRAEEAREVSKQRLELSKQRYKSLFHDNADAIFSIDHKGKLMEVNRAFEKLTGYNKKDLIGKFAFDIIDHKMRRQMKRHFIQTLRRSIQSFEVTIPNTNNEEMELDVNMTPIVADERVLGVYVIMKDITEQRQAERTLQSNEERFRMIAESSHDLITLVDHQGYITYASPSYKYILGHPPEHYVGQSLLHNLHEEDFDRVLDAFTYSKEYGQPISLEFRQKHREEGWLWFELQAKPIYDDHGIQMVVVTRDISERKKYEEQLKLFAYHDPLTELPNRRLFKTYLIDHLKDYQNKGLNFAVMMLDIDNFKSINDDLGHDMGDEVIKEFGKRIKASLRDSDVVARIGGDEFVVLLSNITSKQDAIEIIHRIQKVLENDWIFSGQKVYVTTSIGVAMPDSQSVTEDQLFKIADNALYQAKSHGKDTYELTTIN
nr:PAS domain S-box protein [Alkalibacillus aidingensis]